MNKSMTGLCPPHPFSNDEWQAETVQSLLARLAAQEHAAEHAAWVIVGSGELPYIFGHKPNVSTIYTADQYDLVTDMTQRRVTMLTEHEDWDDYEPAVLAITGLFRRSYLEEIRIARHSGLLGDYETTRQQAGQVELVPCTGDIRRRAREIGEAAATAGKIITHVNVTSLRKWVQHPKIDPDGFRAMHGILDVLPLADDAIIADSSSLLVPLLYTRAEYAELARISDSKS